MNKRKHADLHPSTEVIWFSFNYLLSEGWTSYNLVWLSHKYVSFYLCSLECNETAFLINYKWTRYIKVPYDHVMWPRIAVTTVSRLKDRVYSILDLPSIHTFLSREPVEQSKQLTRHTHKRWFDEKYRVFSSNSQAFLSLKSLCPWSSVFSNSRIERVTRIRLSAIFFMIPLH